MNWNVIAIEDVGWVSTGVYGYARGSLPSVDARDIEDLELRGGEA